MRLERRARRRTSRSARSLITSDTVALCECSTSSIVVPPSVWLSQLRLRASRDDLLEMGQRLTRGAIPGEGHREAPPRLPKAIDERAIRGDAAHRPPHCGDVAMRYEDPRLPVAHGLSKSRRVRCHHWCRTRGGLEVRDSPPLLRRCEGKCPRPAEERELLRLADEPKKPHAIAKVKRARQ